MPKRRVTFEEPRGGEGEEEEEPPLPPRKRAALAGGPGSRFPGKPSLDSDEDDDDDDDEGCAELGPVVEGQEAGPAGEGPGEGGVPLTPFNLEEELGEGHFHPWGGFVPRRPPPPPDPWLDAIDWTQIKPRPPRDPDSAPSPPSPPSPPPLPHLLRGVLELLRPGETVGGALRRLGGRGGRRGRGGGRGEGGGGREELDALAGLADGLVGRGLYGVFQETRERLEGRLRALGEGRDTPPAGGGGGGSPAHSAEGSPAHSAGGSPAPRGRSPALDIFAPEEEEEEGEGGGAPPGVLWEYQWAHGDDARLYGPFSSAQMQAWAAQGYFRGGARCRRVQPPGPFYDCARVDFELYT